MPDIDKYYDTLVEVAGVSAGRFVTSGRFDPALPTGVDHRHAANPDHDQIDTAYRVNPQ